MADSQSVRTITLVPSADPIRQYRFVKLTNTGAVEECDTDNEHAVGVATEASAQDAVYAITIALLDGAKVPVEFGGDVTAGSVVRTDDEGRAVTGTGGTILGIATKTAASGEVIPVLGGVR